MQRTDAVSFAYYDRSLELRHRMESHQLTNDDNGPTILVVEDVEETRDGIENLLRADGYRVDPARTEGDAVARSQRQRPDLILVSLGGRPEAEVVAAACRVRQHAGLSENVPVVIFCVGTIA